MALTNVAVAELLEEAVSIAQPSATKREVEIHVETTEAVVAADRRRLRQSLINLLSNAVKYNRVGGKVRVTTEERGGCLRINVADTGVGIALERRHELFEPFNRLGVDSTEVEGTGIGLAITKRLIEAMRGSIGYESEIGVGSAFWIELPLGDPTLNEEPEPISKPAPRRIEEGDDDQPAIRRTVLYVEDNMANYELFENIVKLRPHIDLLHTFNAEEGIKVARERLPDLIVMDIHLPGMNGYEAMTHLRRISETSSIPVIALSANAMPRDLSRGREAGFKRYLTKPIDVSALLKTLDELASGVAPPE